MKSRGFVFRDTGKARRGVVGRGTYLKRRGKGEKRRRGEEKRRREEKRRQEKRRRGR